MIASILGLTLYVLAIVLILDLSPRRVTEDLLQIITPHQTLHERIKAIRGGKRKKGIYYKLMAMKQALETTGKHSIGFAYIDSSVTKEDVIQVDVRGKKLKAAVVAKHMIQNEPPYGKPVLHK